MMLHHHHLKPSHLLHISRQISTPSHLSQLLSLTVTSGLFASSHLSFLNSLLHSLPPPLSLSLLSSLLSHSVMVAPDAFALTSALKSISSSPSLLPLGQQAHSLSLKLGLHSHTFVLNSLINMYSHCGAVHSSKKVFDLAPKLALDVVSWNTMISGYLKCGLNLHSLWVFCEMLRKCAVRMDGMTPVSPLIACGRIGLIDLGRKIHCLIVVNGFVLDFYLGSALVSMYAKCGDLESARKVFDGMAEKNAVCWTSMISGYSKCGRFAEAVELFREMQVVGVRPNDATVACVASCCGQLGLLDQGRYLHAYCNAKGIGNDLVVRSAFIDMYSKCGEIERAQEMFRGLSKPDVFSWTAMISGLAMNGQSRMALALFSEMEALGQVVPNEVTFLGVLSACSHGGLVEEGFYYFGRMVNVYKLSPEIEHYGCVVDLLGRAKLLTEMEQFIREMPIEPDVVIWRSLLFACRAYGEVKLAEFAARKVIELEPKTYSGNVLLSNVYAIASRWNDVNKVRKVSNESNQKEPGCSFIEINGRVYEFFAADASHQQTKDIHVTLQGISKTMLSEPYTVFFSDTFQQQHKEIYH